MAAKDDYSGYRKSKSKVTFQILLNIVNLALPTVPTVNPIYNPVTIDSNNTTTDHNRLTTVKLNRAKITTIKGKGNHKIILEEAIPIKMVLITSYPAYITSVS